MHRVEYPPVALVPVAKRGEPANKMAVALMLRNAAAIAATAYTDRASYTIPAQQVSQILERARWDSSADVATAEAIGVLETVADRINGHTLYGDFGGLQVLCTALADHVEGTHGG